MPLPSRILTQCPLCHTTYPKEGIRLLGKREGAQLFHCSCEQCGHAVIAIVLENAGWISSVGMVTDMEMGDALRVQAMPVISTDECIAFHADLKEKSQEICAWLATDSQKP
ncbi:MAG: hypothetical protein Q7R83_03125 [bacterium]|nr:hypothetical protein [bacterium]